MQGTLQRQRGGYVWMRVGFATARAAGVMKGLCILAIIALAMWFYLELPATAWRWVVFGAIYGAAGLIYLNLGVWLHEQLHCLGFKGTRHARNVQIVYERRNLLVLGGYYSLRGGMNYQAASRALLGPLVMSVSLLLLGCLGSLVLPGWWMPLMLSLVTVSLLDMLHDLYMYWHIRRIGGNGKFWDRGHFMETVWKV